MISQKCRTNYKSTEKQVDLSSKIIENIKNGTMKEVLSQVVASNESFVIQEGGDSHLISTLSNNLKRADFSSINFGECERLIRDTNGISDNEELILYEVEHSVDGFNIPIIEYVLFTEDGQTQLDLSICNNLTIQYYIPVNVSANDIDKHDPNSDFYNDECNKHSNEDGVDMTLYDRKKAFNDNHMSLCEKGCTFIKFHQDTKKAECDCNIKNDMSYNSDDINKDGLLTTIESEKSNSNLKVTKCFNNVFSSFEKLFTNSAFIALTIILLVFLIIFIIFCIKGKQMLNDKIDEVIYKKFDKKPKKRGSHKKSKESKKNILEERKKESKKIKHYKRKSKKSKTYNEGKSQKATSKFQLIKGTKENNLNLEVINNIEPLKFNQKGQMSTIENNANNKMESIDEPPDKENDYELNILTYSQAIKYDKRSCCDYYSSLLKNKQLFLFTFCTFNDYNSGIIKKFIFFLSFALHYTISALFFNDDTLHQIILDKGEYNFSYQLPKIIISSASSIAILRIILVTLILTDRNVLEVKHQPTKKLAENMKIKVLKCINIKFAIFFVFNFLLLVLFWFYMICLCDTYENTQICLIENTFIALGFSLIYPFIWNIIPSILRMFSLDTENHNRQCIYSLSKILQLI